MFTDEELTLKNEDLYSEEISVEEGLGVSDILRFGTFQASIVRFKVKKELVGLKGLEFDMFMTLEGADESFQIGHYFVDSDQLSSDRAYKEIVAYDRLYDIVNADVAEWYNTLLPDGDSTVTLKEFRDSFFGHFGITQAVVELPNDNMTVSKTVEPSEFGGQTVLNAILEINGCFGRIGRAGLFEYVFLEKEDVMLYPDNRLYPSDELYLVSDDKNTVFTQLIESCEYETYETVLIDNLVIRKEENDIGVSSGDGSSNQYIIEDNFLVYDKGTTELQEIADNIFTVIKNVSLRPVNVTVKGNFCFQAGDYIRMYQDDTIIDSYILSRTISGLLALTDVYESNVREYQESNVSSVRSQIIQLKGRTNKLTRTIEETILEISDIEKGLNTKITQNANAIELEAKRATEAEGNLSSRIIQTAESITSTVAKSQKTWIIPDGLINREVDLYGYGHPDNVYPPTEAVYKKYYLDQQNGRLYGCYTKEGGGYQWSHIGSQLESVESNLSSQIAQNAESIKLKVSKDNIISEINQTAETVTIKAGKIDLQGLVTASEFTSKFASITSLTAVEGRIETIESNYVTTKSLEADYAKITDLNTVNATIKNLETGTISIADALSAAEGRIGTLETDYAEINELVATKITAEQVKTIELNADYITSGTLSADRINADKVAARFTTGCTIRCAHIQCANTLQVGDNYYVKKGLEINGQTYYVLAAV